MRDNRVSIIMPAYNAGSYIREAILSVLAQEHADWELIVVNDGSTDNTGEVIRGFSDPRIRSIEQENKGIGGARNAGLAICNGAFVCFLDADDILPTGSISSRLAIFQQHPGTDFVDGTVITMNADLSREIGRHTPSYVGDPFLELVSLSGRCFFGITWLMRWEPERRERFFEDVSHGEDLLFYIMQGRGKRYRYTTETVLLYRRTRASSMSDLRGLDRSYWTIGAVLRTQPPPVPWRYRMMFYLRSRRAMIGAYWHAGQYRRMIGALLPVAPVMSALDPEAHQA